MKTPLPTHDEITHGPRSKKEPAKTGVAAFAISIIATIAAIRALMFINDGVHSPTEAVIYRWAVILSLGLPLLSVILGLLGTKESAKSNLMGVIGIGVSMFLLSSVGFAYFLSAIF